jgi:hypothetical protein
MVATVDFSMSDTPRSPPFNAVQRVSIAVFFLLILPALFLL